MILANLAKSIRSQNWFAVGIEFLIVVAGVFIGIQVSNWNEERAERLTERQILSDIATDLRSDLEELQNGLDYAERRIGVARFLLDEAGLPKTERVVFPGQSAVLSDSFDEVMREGQPPGQRVRGRLWSQIVLSYYPTPSTAALETITGAGLLGVIRDERLVRDLQLYTQLIEGLMDTQNRSFRPVPTRSSCWASATVSRPMARCPTTR